MKIQTLKYFVTVAECRSISEAAQKLYVAQPSLSKSIQLMENELNVRLFLRTELGVTLTEAGKRILPEAKQVLQYYDSWMELGKKTELKQLNIYAQHSFPDFLLPQAILRLRKHYPGLSINFSTCMSPEKYISTDIECPVLALMVCRSKDSLKKISRIQGNAPFILMHGSYRCLVNARSPLARLKSVNAETLKNYYLVLPTDESPNSDYFSMISSAPRERVVYVNSAVNVIDLVRQDPETYGLSFYPALKRYSGVEDGSLVAIPFENDCCSEALVLFYSRRAYEDHAAVRELVENVAQRSRDFLTSHGVCDPV